MRAFLRHPAAPALGGFLALAAAIGIGRFAWTPILPYMVEELGLDRSRAGFIASANFLGYSSARWARRRPSPPAQTAGRNRRQAG